MNLNKAFIIGRLTSDPEFKTLPSGTGIATFSLATNRVWTNQAGEKQEDTQFHNMVSFGKQAEIVSQYLKKGGLCFIEGRIQTRNWEAQDGSKRYRTEIVVERLQLGPRKAPTSTEDAVGVPTSPEANVGKKDSLDTIEYPEENDNPEKIPF